MKMDFVTIELDETGQTIQKQEHFVSMDLVFREIAVGDHRDLFIGRMIVDNVTGTKECHFQENEKIQILLRMKHHPISRDYLKRDIMAYARQNGYWAFGKENDHDFLLMVLEDYLWKQFAYLVMEVDKKIIRVIRKGAVIS